ncbi:VOC family protein [Parenemella sanctibonifatiensis]|uniref:VOC family protein n=1 Tax=Parenemella sanctibonifatiensis TaxID=2016505 RepID=UPI0015C60EDA|nr:VOC family protein [Parenemella sanctibonifatiensis]
MSSVVQLPPHLDHIIVAAPDLDAAVAALAKATGVTARPGGVHPTFGTRNALVGLGEGHYLELIGPEPSIEVERMPFDLNRTRTIRVATWAVRPDDADAAVVAATQAGLAVGELAPGSRRTAEGDLLTWRLTEPLAADVSGIVPFVIDWGTTTPPGFSLPAELTVTGFGATGPAPVPLDPLDTTIAVDQSEAAGLWLDLTGPQGTWQLPVTPIRD